MFIFKLSVFLTLLGLTLATISGWIMNIVHLVGLDAFVLNGENIIRVIGIFIAPIGAIMGWFF